MSEARDITPRQAWQQDMIETIQILQAQHVETVIAGDFNSSETEGGVIKELCTQCNLEVISNSPKGFSSYRQGKKCIDHVLGSVKISQAVTSIEYEEYPDTYYSDHTPIYLQFNLDTLRSSYSIGKMQRKRRLYSKDHENVREYVKHKAILCQHCRIKEKIEELEKKIEKDKHTTYSKDSKLIKAIIQIDSHLVRISLEAERRIIPRGNTKWSPDAVKCQKECVQLRYQKQSEYKRGNIDATKLLKKQIQKKVES